MIETEILRVILIAGAGLFGFFKAWRAFDDPVQAGGFWNEPRRGSGLGVDRKWHLRPPADHQRIALSLINGLLTAIVVALAFKILL